MGAVWRSQAMNKIERRGVVRRKDGGQEGHGRKSDHERNANPRQRLTSKRSPYPRIAMDRIRQLWFRVHRINRQSHTQGMPQVATTCRIPLPFRGYQFGNRSNKIITIRRMQNRCCAMTIMVHIWRTGSAARQTFGFLHTARSGSLVCTFQDYRLTLRVPAPADRELFQFQ